MSFEDQLASLCAKVAAPIPLGAPRAMGPRLLKPGASMSVGEFNPLKGSVGRSPPAIGAKGISSTGIVNPRRNINQAMSAFTSLKAGR
jgi:hypothetical protein